MNTREFICTRDHLSPNAQMYCTHSQGHNSELQSDKQQPGSLGSGTGIPNLETDKVATMSPAQVVLTVSTNSHLNGVRDWLAECRGEGSPEAVGSASGTRGWLHHGLGPHSGPLLIGRHV